jgi:hypothetical protein
MAVYVLNIGIALYTKIQALTLSLNTVRPVTAFMMYLVMERNLKCTTSMQLFKSVSNYNELLPSISKLLLGEGRQKGIVVPYA